MFYVDYAISLMHENDYKTAKIMLQKALESPIEDEDDSIRKEEAKKLLKEIENK